MNIDYRNIIPELKVSVSTAKKEIMVNLRYPLWVIFWAIMPIFWLAPFIFQGHALVGGRFSEFFEELAGSGDFVTFAIIGSSLYAYVMSALWGMGLSLRREQWGGTLEAILISPCNKFSVLFGKALSDSILTSFYAIVQFALASMFFGATVRLENIFYVVLVVLLMILALYGIGFVLSGVILMYKEPGALLNFVDTLIYTICPVNYPLKALMLFLGGAGYYIVMVSIFFPLTPTLEILRTLLLPSFKPYINIALAASYLIVATIVFLTIGMLLFNFVEKKIREKGGIEAY
ncbi:MAG: ABC transporter permease [Crenarchaeota archaeon]|nr:ABC transporter permease [Thermoproteota archaeon]MDW8033606.1 ABC transporter permease [Nitrososphaerota archaeon]